MCLLNGLSVGDFGVADNDSNAASYCKGWILNARGICMRRAYRKLGIPNSAI